MPKDWISLPYFASEKDVPACPEGWTPMRIDNLFDDVPSGKRYDKKTVFLMGEVPVLDQSAEGYLGFHDDAPGVECSPESPVVSFANHTCEMRLNTRPYSCIHNVFSMAGRLDIATTEFLYYGTKGRVRREEYKGHHPMFREGWIVVPPIPEQRAIASILSVFDDKIELNRRTAVTLEAMARAVFKSWFVDFDPVHAKAAGRVPEWMDGETAALFPDRFGDDGLPEGWASCPLDQCATFLNGLALQKFPAEGDDFLPIIKIRELRTGITEASGKASVSIAPEYIVNDGDVLFSWSGTLEVLRWAGGTGALNQHLFKVTPRYGLPQWLIQGWCLHHLDEFRGIAADKATTMGHIKRGHLSMAHCAIPDLILMGALDGLISPLYERAHLARLESKTLEAIRDALLPRLLSGELRVDDAEKVAEGVL